MAFLLNLLIDVPWKFYYKVPVVQSILGYNNFFYNLHSVIRMFFLMWFFAKLRITTKYRSRLLLYLLAACFIITFIFLEPIDTFSSQTFTLEGIVLIILCILYFLKRLRSDEVITSFDASLYIVTGLAIYEAVCFPIFLFYDMLMEKTEDYAVSIWDVHNIAYIVFCLFIARALYGNLRHTQQ